MQRLEVLGWWFHEQAPTGLPRPQLLVAPMPAAERDAVLRYLRAGKVLVRYPEPSFCRFACGEEDLGRTDRTDGRFVWPCGLPHYVERHDVRLPAPFVAHAVAAAGVVAPFALPKPAFGLYDTGPWLAWSRAQRACLDVDGWDIPLGDVLARIEQDLGPVPHEAILLCRGATREVVLDVGGGAIEVHQLRAGGHAPRRLAGWHEWPIAGATGNADAASSAPPSKKGRGPTMAEFFAERRAQQERDRPPE